MVYFLSLGSNMGNRQQHMNDACRLLEERCGHVLRRSSDFFSDPWGYTKPFSPDDRYLNICVAIQSDLSPFAVLNLTQQIERDLGRTVKSQPGRPYQNRPMDIDILLCVNPLFNLQSPIFCPQIPVCSLKSHHSIVSSLYLSSPVLTIPHPLMTLRPFVMYPLIEIL